MHHHPAWLLGIRPGLDSSPRVTSPAMILYTILHVRWPPTRVASNDCDWLPSHFNTIEATFRSRSNTTGQQSLCQQDGARIRGTEKAGAGAAERTRTGVRHVALEIRPVGPLSLTGCPVDEAEVRKTHHKYGYYLDKCLYNEVRAPAMTNNRSMTDIAMAGRRHVFGPP